MGDIVKVLLAFIVIGLPVILIFGQPFLKRLLEHREKRMEIEVRMTAEKAAQYAAQTERLEQRVRVLERIVTDKGLDVAEEIERLRDERPEPKRPLN
jgi:energy-converting hydrogenase Eha subunit H